MSAFEHEQLSGLAGKIRQSVESEQFDLSGYTEIRTHELMISAFSKPFAVSEMIRFQFVVGGGKLVLKEYNDSMARWCSSALREINFTEDSSATCILDCQGGEKIIAFYCSFSNPINCMRIYIIPHSYSFISYHAGTYKMQHDLGQNLKFFYVFPHIIPVMRAVTGPVAETSQGALDTKSKEYLVVAADVSTFKEMVTRKVLSWGQKKRLLKHIQNKAEVVFIVFLLLLFVDSC